MNATSTSHKWNHLKTRHVAAVPSFTGTHRLWITTKPEANIPHTHEHCLQLVW